MNFVRKKNLTDFYNTMVSNNINTMKTTFYLILIVNKDFSIFKYTSNPREAFLIDSVS